MSDERRESEAGQAWLRKDSVLRDLPAVRAAVDNVESCAGAFIGAMSLRTLELCEDDLVDAIAALRDAVEAL